MLHETGARDQTPFRASGGAPAGEAGHVQKPPLLLRVLGLCTCSPSPTCVPSLPHLLLLVRTVRCTHPGRFSPYVLHVTFSFELGFHFCPT
ncbi:Lipase_GDSL domain-containing protein [Psidium guajava]|nr:Lipase_GDSL domain-containing protein [Psidium guajava]